MPGSSREYRIPSSFVNLFGGFILALFTAAIWAMWFLRPHQLTVQERFIVLLMLFLPSLFALCMVKRISVQIGDKGIASVSPFSTRYIEWDDVEDLVTSERLILIRDSRGQAIKLFHAEFGSVEPFEDLKESILTHALPRAKLSWGRMTDRLVVSYPTLSSLTWIGYVIPFLVVALILVSLSIRLGLPLMFGVFGLVAAGVVVGPFLVRDVLKTRKRLIVSHHGLVCEGGRKKITISWEEIGQIVVKEPLTVGYGEIIVRSKKNKTAIAIPRAIKKCGHILHLLQARTGLPLSQTFDY